MLTKAKLYKAIAEKVGCSVGFVQHVDCGYRSKGEKTLRVVAALKAAYEAEKGIEKAIKAA